MSDEFDRLWLKVSHAFTRTYDVLTCWIPSFEELNKAISTNVFGIVTLEDTIEEKIGGGPHGYGDPADTTIREEEHYLFPRMIWKKIRFEKCCDVTDRYYECVNEAYYNPNRNCKNEETAMFKCKAEYYTPEKMDEVEKECISEYVKLRSKFRETGSEEDSWKIKMMLLEPIYDKLRQYEKDGMPKEELDKIRPGYIPPKEQ
ncbi:hypothetical protein ONE63_006959 [Megalurothrips usitatus]|uniref:Uncharacterized protein n=1 Tax=Megalurothrips usitatus TaxID=439358 RepID=A0AAV7XXF9_9NEOP|nr:hypothetical protein ONE63_006959 [Megalurothrips usitatus]